jgi:small subunit ribosomal protein S4
MARPRPTEKISRRLGVELGLKGARALRGKSGLARRPYPPGLHGRRYRRGKSDYLVQLQEKQKARFFYGMRESQFRRVFHRAVDDAQPTGAALVRLLELRLDNVLHRLGLASTRAQARQFITHRHVEVGERIVDRPSFEVSPGDRLRIRPGSAIEPLAREALDLAVTPPPWLAVDREAMSGTVLREPTREEALVPFDEALIVQFYSR